MKTRADMTTWIGFLLAAMGVIATVAPEVAAVNGPPAAPVERPMAQAIDPAVRPVRNPDAAQLTEALARARALPDSRHKAYILIEIGLAWQGLDEQALQPQALKSAHESLQEAQAIADRLGDAQAQSYAMGYMARLYARQGHPAEALTLARRAVFAATEAQAPESLYQWQWDIGRWLKANGDTDGAISAYRQAVYHLQQVRPALVTREGVAFRKAIEPVFFELADLLLARSAAIKDPQAVQPYLLEARDTMEQLKAAELADYFQDECVADLQSRLGRVDHLAAQTAALYPILLADRTELLLSLPEGIRRFSVPVDRARLTQAVREFRQKLEKRTTREFLPHAQTLYQWLIAPLEAELKINNIKTLIVVPDGPLRTIPMAALHDGHEFLISRYALGTTPGLRLTDLRPSRRQDIEVLANGLTQGVQGFAPLEHVGLELESIRALYDSTLLKDSAFKLPNVRAALAEAPYSIVHIASHGQFASDVDDTFLLTFDDRLTLNRLEQVMGLSQYRERPVELLTLSACQSAAGDDRAALGLAGIAVKSGARSALATLWLINDEASSRLITEFYRNLRDADLTKAQALQKAQQTLLADRRYRHPGYWAPFLLIGNWL